MGKAREKRVRITYRKYRREMKTGTLMIFKLHRKDKKISMAQIKAISYTGSYTITLPIIVNDIL